MPDFKHVLGTIIAGHSGYPHKVEDALFYWSLCEHFPSGFDNGVEIIGVEFEQKKASAYALLVKTGHLRACSEKPLAKLWRWITMTMAHVRDRLGYPHPLSYCRYNLATVPEVAALLRFWVAEPRRAEIRFAVAAALRREIARADSLRPRARNDADANWRAQMTELACNLSNARRDPTDWLWNLYTARHGPGTHHWVDVLKDMFGDFGAFREEHRAETELLLLTSLCEDAVANELVNAASGKPS